MRRLPVYLLLDTSGSMRGEPIESVKVGLQAMISSLRRDPQALESVYISIITFDSDVKVLLPLTALEDLRVPDLESPESGPTHLGLGLEELCKQVDREVIKNHGEVKGDWKPMLFVMTDGRPSDAMKFKEMIPEVRRRNFATIVACAAGPKAKKEDLVPLADHVLSLDSTDSSTFAAFFQYVSDAVSTGGTSVGVVAVPPPAPSASGSASSRLNAIARMQKDQVVTNREGAPTDGGDIPPEPGAAPADRAGDPPGATPEIIYPDDEPRPQQRPNPTPQEAKRQELPAPKSTSPPPPTPSLDIQITIPNGMVGKPYDSLVTLHVHKTSELPRGYRSEDVTILPRQIDGLDGLGLQTRPDGPDLRVKGEPKQAGDHKIVVHFTVMLRGKHWITGNKRVAFTINPDPRSLWKEIEPDPSQPFRRPHLRHERVVGDSVLIAASRRGRSHANKGDHRDDEFRIEHSAKSGWYALAVADGAGSAPVSRRGAEVACDASLQALKAHVGTTLDEAFHALIPSYANGDDSAREAIHAALYDSLGGGGRAAYQAIADEAAQHGRPVEQFATTLNLTLARKYDCGWFVAAIAVGDGGVGALGEGGDVKVLNSPDSGEFAGQTRFLTMPRIWADDADVRSRIQFAVVPDLVALVAMTDGVSDPKFPTEKDFFDSARWRAFWDGLKAEVRLDKANDRADSELLDWLNFWAVGSHDDRTIAILLP